MSNFVEQSINTYSGLSTETKPTIAAGNNVPNGSRWREVDTDKVYFFNISDDTWYDFTLSTPAITGFATSAKQDTLLTELEKKADLTETQPATLLDSVGNSIASFQDAGGNYHLASAMIQNILTSSGNTTTTNLTAGTTFTGVAEEAFGISGIQVFHSADQDCIIYVDQSVDNTFADTTQTIIDSFECLANLPCTRTYTSVAPYFRLRITNTGSSATTKILSAAGMTPIINPLPRSLTEDGRLVCENTIVGQQNTERHVWVTPTNSMSVESPVRLVGTNFDGAVKDTNFWTEAVTGTGSVTQSGEIQLDTGITANSTASYTSVRKARFVVGAALKFQGLFKFVTAGTTDNVRRCGAYETTDGFFFQLDGTVFSIGYRKTSSDTLVSSGSFNGNYGPNFTPLITQYYKLEIEWTPKGVFFYVDGKLLHKDGTGHRSNKMTLPITFENVNDNGCIVDVAFDCLGVVIVRLGNLITNSTSYHISGNAATHVLKYGAGVLQKIMFNNTSGTSITIYDNTSAAAPVIGIITTASAALGGWTYDVPFSNGLTLVTVGNSLDATVIYE